MTLNFDRKLLTDLVEGKVRGAVVPFDSGDPDKTEEYIRLVVGQIQKIWTLKVDAEFGHYGSGYASYVHLYISKRDGSGTKVENNDGRITEGTKGLMLYLCRLAPYAVYAPGYWSKTFEDGRQVAGYSHYIEPAQVEEIPDGWGSPGY